MRSATKFFEHLIWFTLFLLLYYTPVLLDIPSSDNFDHRVRYLLDDLLASDLVRLHLILNVFTHLLLGLLAYVILSAISRNAPFVPAESRPAKALILIVGCFAIMAANQLAFPASNYAVITYMFGQAEVAATLISLIIFLSAWSALKSVNIKNSLIVCFFGVSIFMASSFTPIHRGTSKASNKESKNIIIIGVDSLSYDTFQGYRQLLPNLNRLFSSSWEFSRAYTPMGRTFPAWTSIFSGLYPADHKAIFNLRSLNQIDTENMLPKQLQLMGYETIFALDERRFNNMDESFGFDTVIGPTVGALDFLLQKINDTPLTNFVLQSRMAAWLLPYSHQNSASTANYDADGFVENIIHNRRTKNPLFLAAHFESAHFPYKSRHSTLEIDTGNSLFDRHLAALEVVDRQVGSLMSALKKTGELNNALLVVLSDHGESFGEVEATVRRQDSTIEIMSFGHGMRLDSRLEQQVVLGLSEFRNGVAVTSPREISTVSSLVEIRAMLEKYLASGYLGINPADPCVHMESGILFNGMYELDKLDVNALISEAVQHYQVTKSGLLQIKDESINDLISRKSFGLICKETLTIYNSLSDEFTAYSLDANGKISGLSQRDSNREEQISAYIARERANNSSLVN